MGVDLVDRVKFKAVFLRHGRFKHDVFTDPKRASALGRREPWKHFATCFAAKEACLKALGIGFLGLGIDHALREVAVVSEVCAAVHLLTYGWVGRWAAGRGVRGWSVSVS